MWYSAAIQSGEKFAWGVFFMEVTTIQLAQSREPGLEHCTASREFQSGITSKLRTIKHSLTLLNVFTRLQQNLEMTVRSKVNFYSLNNTNLKWIMSKSAVFIHWEVVACVLCTFQAIRIIAMNLPLRIGFEGFDLQSQLAHSNLRQLSYLSAQIKWVQKATKHVLHIAIPDDDDQLSEASDYSGDAKPKRKKVIKKQSAAPKKRGAPKGAKSKEAQQPKQAKKPEPKADKNA